MYNDKLTLTTLRIVFEFLYNKCRSKLYETDFDVEGGYAFKSSQYTNDGCFVLRVTNINPDGSIDYLNDKKFVNDEKLIKELSNFVIKENDVLIVMVGGSLGKVGLVTKEVLPALLNQNLWKIKFDKDFSSKYVFYLSLYLNQFKAIIKTSTHGHFSRKKYRELEIPNISKVESFRVSEYLDSIFLNKEIPDNDFFNECSEQLKFLFRKEENTSKITTELNHQLALVKELRQAYLREAMQGKLARQDASDEPAEILLEKIKAEKEKLVAEKRIRRDKPLPPINAEEIPFEIPSNWTWCRMGEISYIASGSTPKQDAFVETGVPYLKMYNLRNQKVDFDYRSQFIKESVHYGQLKRCIAFPGDVLMNIVGPPLGKLAIVPESLPECNFNQAMVLIRPLEKSLNKWIYFYLNEMSEINSIATKGVAGQDNISVTQSKNMKLPLPPLAEQERIVAKLEKLMKFCDELEANIRQGITNADQLLQTALKEALEPKET